MAGAVVGGSAGGLVGALIGMGVPEEGGDDCARFEGGGGHVLVQLCEVDAGVEVELETREWDYDAKQFLEKI